MSPFSRASQVFPQAASALREGRSDGQSGAWAGALASRVLLGAALVLLGAVAGLAAGQTMATRSAHRTGACAALNMAAALGYLDTEQQRRVRYALATAVNPDVELFAGDTPSLRGTCSAAADR
jgi:hypothetical protein